MNTDCEPDFREAESTGSDFSKPGFEEALTLTQTAEILRVSIPTARRLVSSKRLPAVKMMVNDRLCWRVPRQAVAEFSQSSFSEASEATVSGVRFRANPSSMNPPSKWASDASRTSKPASPSEAKSVPLEAHMAALKTAQKAMERLEKVEQMMEEQRTRAELAERQHLALEMQMRQYQVALADQAESLAQERAENLASRLRTEAEKPTPAADLSLLKVSTPRPSFGQKIRGWLGFKIAQ